MDWKVAAVIAVVIVVFATAFLASDISGVGDGVSGFFTAISGGTNGNISINAVLNIQEMDVDTMADSIEVEVIDPSSEITIGTNKVDFSGESSVKLEITEWKGKIITGDRLSLDGTASKIKMNGITLTPENNAKILIEKLDYADLKVTGVFLPKISFDNAEGYIYINDGKTTVRVDEEPVEIGSFAGDIKVDSSLRFEGTTSRLLVSGENQMSIQ